MRDADVVTRSRTAYETADEWERQIPPMNRSLA